MSGDAYEEAADALYGLPPEEFTAARTVAVKAARAAGDRDLAMRLQALRRPTVVAWLANQLVRAHRSEIAEMVSLGGQLREATAALDREALRALASDQQRLVQALVQQAKAMAAAGGRRVGDDAQRGLEETLHAALADPDAATQLLAGRLVDGLQHSGFPLVEVSSGPTPVPAPTRAPTRAPAPAAPVSRAVPAATAKAVRAAEEAVREARDTESSAAAARTAAADALAQVRESVSDAQSQLGRLREEVKAATALLVAAERDATTAGAALQRAERAAAEATRRRQTAERRLAALTGEG